MNRKERRNTEGKLHKLGFSKSEAKTLIKLGSGKRHINSIPEGTKVKLNIEKTEKGNPARNKWVDENIDNIFTVKYDSKYGDNPIMVEFEEYPLWLWCVDELIAVSE